MKLYAILHKPSGKYLPQSKNGFYGRRKAATHVSMEYNSGIPRLFAKKQHAAQCINWWLAGKSYYERFPATIDEPADYDIKTVPVKNRIKEDLEIVEVEILPVCDEKEAFHGIDYYSGVKEWKKTDDSQTE